MLPRVELHQAFRTWLTHELGEAWGPQLAAAAHPAGPLYLKFGIKYILATQANHAHTVEPAYRYTIGGHQIVEL